jgi:Bacterial TniB protein
MTREERVAKIRGGRWIRYPLADRIAAKLEELLLLPKTHRMPNLLIVGETNNGKTVMLSRFVRQHPPQESDGEVASGIPVIAIEAPPVPDERRFYAEILRQVFAPFRSSKPVGQLQYEVLRLLATVEVKLLIVDEIQHVLAGPLLKQRQFLNVIKHLGNELQIPIVAAGTQDAFNAIQTDPQLANRFEPAVLRRWTMGEDYLRLLASFEVALPLEHRSGLVEPALALKILSLSEGTIGEISALLCRAAIDAIESETEQITSASLDRCGYVAPSERRRAATVSGY